jgi:hypothetical protein
LDAAQLVEDRGRGQSNGTRLDRDATIKIGHAPFSRLPISYHRRPGHAPAGVVAGYGCEQRLAGFFYGHEPSAAELLQRARRKGERAGLDPQLINIPLGHPGDSLGAKDGDFPLTPPRHWRPGRRSDGTTFAWTSLHPPATSENVAALKRLGSLGFSRCFLDDDFRLARAPGEIGGRFCYDHRDRFLRESGYAPGRWEELLDDLRNRRLTPLLRQWVLLTCDDLTAAFRAQQQAFDSELGNMVMYLGVEKTGIRLAPPGQSRA